MEFIALNLASADAKVFQFGIRIAKEQREALREQFFLGHRLYNDSIAEIRSVGQSAIEFLQSKSPESSVIREKLTAYEDSLKAARADDDREQYESLTKEYRALWGEWYKLLHAARKEHGAELREQYMNQLLRRKECKIMLLRREAAAAGLGADTATEVLISALQAFAKTWPRFELPSFKRFADKPLKTIVIQFKKPISIDDIFAGTVSELKITPERIGKCAHIVKKSEKKYSKLQIRIGAYDKRAIIDGTVYLHRPVPSEAKICYATIVERRIGKDLKHYLQLSVTGLMAETPAGGSGIVAIHTGWTQDGMGIQIAGIATDAGEAHALYANSRVSEMLDGAERLESVRDKKRDEVVEHLKAVTVNDAPPELAEQLIAIRKLPTHHVSQKRLAQVVWLWKKTCPEYAPALLERLNEWRKSDKLLLQTSSHAAFRARNLRKGQYEETAAQLANEHGTILLSKPDLKAAARIKKEKTGEHTEFKPDARKNRSRVALSVLHEKVVAAAAKKQRAIVGVAGERANLCAECGSAIEYQKDRESYVCTGCRRLAEPLVNAAKYIAQSAAGDKAAVDEAYTKAVETQQGKLQKRIEGKARRMEKRKQTAAEERKAKEVASAEGSELE